MKIWPALLPLLFLFSEAPSEAQSRFFAGGRLISREVRITSNCLKASEIPPIQSIGPGITIPVPKLPPCELMYSGGTQADPKPTLRYSQFQIDQPPQTPAGTLTVAGSIANLEFDRPLNTRIATTAAWELNPPPGQTVGTHVASFTSQIEGFTASPGSCTGTESSNNAAGSLSLDVTCPVNRTASAWNAATQIATFTEVTSVTFKFGNNNGEYTVNIRSTYAVSQLSIDHIEVLQTVQTPDNSVPLVAGKRALVRVFPMSSPGSPTGATVRLRILRGDEVVQTLESGTIAVAGGAPSRSDLSRSANFLIPSELAFAGDIKFEAELKEGQGDYFGKTTLATSFQSAPGWPSLYEILYAQFCDEECGAADALAGFNQTLAMMPMQQQSVHIVRFPSMSPLQAVRSLFRLRFALESELPASVWPMQYVGHNPANSSDDICPDARCSLSDPYFAQGQKKLAYVGGPAANRIPCVIGANLGLAREVKAIGEIGLTSSGLSLIDPETLDFMSCAEQDQTVWISPANAKQLFDTYGSKVPANRPATAKAASADPVEYTVITGTLSADGSSATFDPIYRVRSANEFAATEGRYCLHFTSGGSTVGSDSCFAIPDSNVDRPFGARVILPPGTDRITLLVDGTEIGSTTKSANAPVVQFTSPAEGVTQTERNLNVTWTVTDADGSGSMLSQLWSSTDNGQTWIPAALDLPGTSFSLDTTRFGSATSLILQVRSSDGFNDSSATLGSITLGATPALAAPTAGKISDTRVNEGVIFNVRLNNSGAGNLQITSVESSIPSLSLTGTTLPFVVPGQQSADLPLLFTATEAGAFTANITLRTNDPARPTVVVPISGFVYQQTGPVATYSSAALDFGVVNIGATIDQQVRITNRGNEPLIISDVAVNPSQVFRLVGTTNATVNPAGFTDLTVRCSPAAGVFSSGTLTALTNDPSKPRIAISVACSGVSPSLEVQAGVVDFGTVASGQSRIQQIVVRNITASAITIVNAVFTNAQFRLVTPALPAIIAAGTSATFDVQFAPAVGGVATAVLTLDTNQPAVGASVALRGIGTGSSQTNGRLTLEPNQLVFGEVTVNQNRTLPLTLRNTGSGLLTVTAITSNNPAFTISGINIPTAIAVGTSVEAQIRFSPTSASAFNSVLTISSDSTTSSDEFLSLSGTGLPIPATTVSNIAAPLRQDWTARAFLTSFGPEDAILRFVRFDGTGTQVTDTGLTIPAGSQLQPDIDSGGGWTQVRISKGAIGGYLQYSAQQAQTFDVLPLSPALASKLIMPGLERGSDIVLNNLISDNNAVSLELRNNNGSVIGSQSITLGSRASLAQRVEQLFNNVPQGFQGYLLITASQGLQATRTNSGATAMEASPATPAPVIATRNVSLYAPHIQAGNGWLARLQVINPTDREARVTIRAASNDGGTVATPVQVVIPAGNAYWREFTQIFDLSGNVTWNASLTVESNLAGIVAEVSYGNSFARGAYSFVETGARTSVIPTNTASTKFYIYNPNSTAASVDLRNLLEDGTYGPGRRISIPKGGYYGAASGLVQSPALRIESDLPVIAHASITSEQVLDFGVLQAVNLDGSSGDPTPGTTPRLQVDPPSLDFGTVLIGQSKALTLSIRNGGAANLTVNSITSSNTRFSPEGSFPITILPGVTQLVTVRFTATAAGPQTGQLTVTSNDSVTGPVTITLNGSGTATEVPKVRIEVSPLALDFGDVPSGQTKDLLVNIRNGGTDTLIISGATLSNSRFQLVFANFPLSVGPSSLATIQVRFAPSTAGSQTGTLVLASNDSANPSTTISLRGNGVGAASSPKIVSTATNLEFGTVQVGETGERTFEIRNTGTAPLVVQSLVVDNAAYTVGPATPFTLAVNAIADIAVNFKPREPGNKPANLRIISNDPVNGTIVIPITGAGQ